MQKATVLVLFFIMSTFGQTTPKATPSPSPIVNATIKGAECPCKQNVKQQTAANPKLNLQRHVAFKKASLLPQKQFVKPLTKNQKLQHRGRTKSNEKPSGKSASTQNSTAYTGTYIKLVDAQKLIDALKQTQSPTQTLPPTVKSFKINPEGTQELKSDTVFLSGTAVLSDGNTTQNLNGLVEAKPSKNVDAHITKDGKIAIDGLNPGKGTVNIVDAKTGVVLETINTNQSANPAASLTWWGWLMSWFCFPCWLLPLLLFGFLPLFLLGVLIWFRIETFQNTQRDILDRLERDAEIRHKEREERIKRFAQMEKVELNKVRDSKQEQSLTKAETEKMETTEIAQPDELKSELIHEPEPAKIVETVTELRETSESSDLPTIDDEYEDVTTGETVLKTESTFVSTVPTETPEQKLEREISESMEKQSTLHTVRNDDKGDEGNASNSATV